jgi:hypothetical protein
MGTGKRRISSAAMPASSLGAELAIARAAEPGHDPVVAELALGPVVAELALGPVQAELEHVQVEAEPERVQVEAELELGPVQAELELVQEEAVPAQGQPRAQLAVALRTKSVTGAHRRGLVLHLAAEDLAAAAAETTREPAAAEAVIAWEVAE